MYKIVRIAFYLLLIFNMISCSTPSEETKGDEDFVWNNLIDKNLSQWDTYLSFKHQLGYDGSPPTAKDGTLISPIGMNPQNYDVFSTLEKDEETMIKVSGEYYGCLISKEAYENYHLRLKFKWGNKKWIPRKDLLKDSGILYHSIGPPGVEHWRTWMLSQEFQIMEGHTGDYWSQATSAIDIRAYTPEYLMNPMAHETQDYLHIGEGGPYNNYCLRSTNAEKPHGEWNTLDLICYQDKSLHIVNGEIVMVLKNSRYVNAEGKVLPLTKGKIQLQSEVAELYFKNIQIRSLDSLASNYATHF